VQIKLDKNNTNKSAVGSNCILRLKYGISNVYVNNWYCK